MNKRSCTNTAVATLVGLVFAASTVPVLADDVDQYSDWSAPVNIGPEVNTVFGELAPFISKNGLSLYFFSDRPEGFGSNDIYVSQRASVDDPWGPPQNLGSTINTAFNENAPTLTRDGHRLYFATDRPGGIGGLDLYVSRRHNKRNDFAWRPPENLGSGVNSVGDDAAAAHFEDDESGTITLYFQSNRSGGDDIYASVLNEDGDDENFGAAVLVPELSSPALDRLPGIRRDGLEIFISSNRPGTLGLLDLWVSTRASTAEPWSTAVNLGPVINSGFVDGRAMLSFDGTVLYFHSTRPGGVGFFDLYVSQRTKDDEDDD